ncbi:MAG: phosphatidate cytidylyltransferase [Firmicutes bacterium]|nr:phosphatidate cytidylyltransferase [Bacillota bacterium]
MKTRIISGLVMAPLLLIVYFGGPLLTLACFLIGIIGSREFYSGFAKMGVKASYAVTCTAALALYAIDMFIDSDSQYFITTMQLWFFAVVLASCLYLFKIDERQPADAMATITGTFYVVFFSYHVTAAEQSGEYGMLVWLIFLTAFGTDIMAYFTGYFLGKHKLCPKISPKKTIEGSIGGIIGSTVLSALFGYFFFERIFIHCIIIGVLGGVVSQFGDLTASVFKRKMGIKDYGSLIPGHGGILDRFDSVLFTAPMVYYYIMLVLS